MNVLRPMLDQLERRASRAGVTSAQWAKAAGVRPETLSRLFKRDDCDLGTLSRLARAVGLQVALRERLAREMPSAFGREEEERLLRLAESRSLDAGRWAKSGPRYFMAGLAVLLSGEPLFNQDALLLLAEALYPGMTEVDEFQRWLDDSPLRPARFLPMLGQRLRHVGAA